MDINKILNQLDALFETKQIEKVESFLTSCMELAQKEGDVESQITLWNEMIGFYRDISQYEKCLVCCENVKKLMIQVGLEDTTAFATTLLNVATGYRACGLLKESEQTYRQVFAIYRRYLEPDDFRYASLYNNLSLLYEEMENYEAAIQALEEALVIVSQYDAPIEQAVSHTNLARCQLKVNRMKEALEHLSAAAAIFEKDEPRDYHYSACLGAMGEAYYKLGQYRQAACCYADAMRELQSNVGKTQGYWIMKENLDNVLEQLRRQPDWTSEQEKMLQERISEKPKETEQNHSAQSEEEKADEAAAESGMELCRNFYREYGAPMIHTLFPEYESRIAVGLAGEGSECFGFDDLISRDHDFGPGFCLWVTRETWDAIGQKLQNAYDSLPKVYHGIQRAATSQGKERVGVCTIHDFYCRILGTETLPETEEQWMGIEEYALAAATNGAVFRDDEGIFTAVRNRLLSYYPESLRRKKIAVEMIQISQSGQYNYGRMMRRGEYVTAGLALAEFMKHTMSLVYLLNRRYAPYYKWMHRGMDKLPVLAGIMDVLNAIADMPSQRDAWKPEQLPKAGPVNSNDQVALTIELVCALFLEELQKQGIVEKVNGEDYYLEHYAAGIIQRSEEEQNIKKKENKNAQGEDKSLQEREKGQNMTREELVDRIVQLEWNAFDKVINEGGRASCQDDWQTFQIMRKSQYLAWTEELLMDYLDDFAEANRQGRNLIAEKYGQMMESTAPEQYEQIKAYFPVFSEQRKALMEQVIAIQVGWMEDFSRMYPYMSANARVIHTNEDEPYETSYETYLRGELCTYSERTMYAYGRFIAELCREGKNLAQMIMTNTALLYGYESLEAAEASLEEQEQKDVLARLLEIL